MIIREQYKVDYFTDETICKFGDIIEIAFDVISYQYLPTYHAIDIKEKYCRIVRIGKLDRKQFPILKIDQKGKIFKVQRDGEYLEI